MVIDALAERGQAGTFRDRYGGRLVKTRLWERDVVLLKPMTYMNLSGESVRRTTGFYKTPVQDLLVVHDELDLDFGVVRVKFGGGTAGHKGLESIVEQCGTADFARVRVGIGRPPHGDAEHYVLSDFGEGERAMLPDVIRRAGEALACIVERGVQEAMNQFNSRTPQGDAII